MRRIFLAAAAVVLSSSFASAADMPAKAPVYKAPVAAPVYNWTGFYIGGHVGAAWPSDSAFTMTDPLGSFTFAANPQKLSAHSSAKALGGVQLGYNWQFNPNWLVGVEADWSGTRMSLQANAPIMNPVALAATSAFAKVDANNIVSVRGRFGYTTPVWMLYATGGWAYARLDYSGGWTCNIPTCPGGPYLSIANFSKNASGWVLGAGTEIKLPASPLIFGAEYLYYRLDSSANGIAAIVTATGGTGGCVLNVPCNPVTFSNFNVQVLRARVSYKF